MIFQRALVREFANGSVAVFLALLAITLTVQLVRLLGRAAGGAIPSDAVVAFLGFFTLYALPLLLSVTLFVAVLMTLVRSYRDSEMVIWLGSGQSLTAWLKPVFAYALPVVALIAVLALVVSPWAADKGLQYAAQIEERDDVSRVTPGVFGESKSRERVFFVEAVEDDANRVRNVFISSVQQGRQGLMLSRSGRLMTAANGDRFIVLEDGRRYEGEPGAAGYRVTEFERYALRVQRKARETPELTARNASTLALVGVFSDAFRGELMWRIAIPVSALLLALMAIPLSFVNPRAPRLVNLVFALLIWISYWNLMVLVRGRIAQDRLDFWIGVWIVHGVMLLLLLAMYVYRTNPFLLRWRRSRE
ncbi:MAG TPA: LPS export ABC transporter permease LptF [Burkholderiales bacterium]|nr:LPS export ABC transporter permease LptF [Burkholderiales bacterium]